MADDMNPAEVEQFLGGLNYPASKQQVVDRARDNGASEDVMDALDKLPDRTFNSPADVNRALGEEM